MAAIDLRLKSCKQLFWLEFCNTPNFTSQENTLVYETYIWETKTKIGSSTRENTKNTVLFYCVN